MAPVLELILQGGLGNQLFQWCAADRLRIALGLQKIQINEARYEVDSYGRRPLIRELLPNLCYTNATPQELGGAKKHLLTESIDTREMLATLPEHHSVAIDSDHIILDGYWQDYRIVTERQVEQLTNAIRSATVKTDNHLLEKIRSSSNPVSVHIRRHDYAHHGLCDVNYYIEAIQTVRSARSDSEVYVFSDEPNFASWAFSQAKIPCNVTRNNTPLIELGLMSLFDTHIISNSTFSWWGARLARASTVICPAPWSYIHTPSEHLIPMNWRIVENSVIQQRVVEIQKDRWHRR